LKRAEAIFDSSLLCEMPAETVYLEKDRRSTRVFFEREEASTE